jgi:uncharacterized protein YbbC (DUF1343 family)
MPLPGFCASACAASGIHRPPNALRRDGPVHRMRQLQNPADLNPERPAVHKLLTLATLLPVLLACASVPPQRAHVLMGVDRLAEGIPEALIGRRVGLITNHTGRDRSGRSTIDILHERDDLELVALFAPEHGIRGERSGRIDDEVDERTGLPVHSLYGDTRSPTPAMLEGVEALVFDIQDVGVRQYTYFSTMGLAMQAAARKGIPFVVLDRPNPIGGVVVEGNLLDPAFSSFVGLYPIASRHGMTAGEIAMMYNDHFGIGADLTVIEMEGWRRDLWFDETDLPWHGPSPNLPLLLPTIHYPGTVFFEGTNLSEGRATTRPFEQTGAPWLRARELADSMNALALPGVAFEAVEFAVEPGRRRFAGQTIPGVRYVLTDRERYRPVAATLLLIEMAYRLHPEHLHFNVTETDVGSSSYLDLLSGTDRVRAAIQGGTLRELLAEWEADAERFRQMRRPFLLY